MNKSGLLPIEQQVRSAINRNFTEVSGPSLVMGVSGGADSMCLLHIFKQLEVDIRVVHVNYGKRGEASDRDEELVERLSSEWNFPFRSISMEEDEKSGNFQQQAREFRYRVFRSVKRESGADGIALAHHEDDQLETILMKQFRGAGLASWSAMKEWDGELFRPLLEVTKEEIKNYCEERDIPYRTDASNLESNYARNFLRNEWFPKLEKWFPGWRRNVLRVAEQSRLFENSLQWILDRLTDSRDRLDRAGVLEMDPELRKALILQLLNKIDPDAEISKDALDELEKIGELQTGKQIQLSDSLFVMRDREYFKVVYEQPDSLRRIELTKSEMEKKPLAIDNLVIALEECTEPELGKDLYLDPSRIQWPITLRQWKDGDRFQPLGMEGHQNISDHLANAKVSSSEKHLAMVIESFEETICAVIFPPIENRVPPGTISEQVKWKPDTRQCLTVKRTV